MGCCNAAEVFVTLADSLWSCGIDTACVLSEGTVLANTLGGVKGFNFGIADGTSTCCGLTIGGRCSTGKTCGFDEKEVPMAGGRRRGGVEPAHDSRGTLTTARPPTFPLIGDTITTAVVVLICEEDGNLDWLTIAGFVKGAAFSVVCWVTSVESADTEAIVTGAEMLTGAEVAGAIERGPLRDKGRRRSRSPGTVGITFGVTLGGKLGVKEATLGVEFGTAFCGRLGGRVTISG